MIPSSKRMFSLIEVLIALGLAGLLLTVLFQFLISNTRFQKSIEKAQASLREQQRLSERIESLLLSLDFEGPVPVLYTKQMEGANETSLIARFNAGIDPDPAYSGANLGCFVLDQQHRFCFIQWPRDKEGFRAEVLAEHIADIEWEFLGTNFISDPRAIAINEKWSWMKQWPKAMVGIPPIVRLRLWKEPKKNREADLKLAFILPDQEPIRIMKEK